MLHVGETYTVIIEDSNIFANGVCRIDGITIFVENALIGDKCVIEITKVLTSYAYAKCVEILISSSFREKRTCPHSFSCGGCSFDGIDLEIENEIKRNYVASSFFKQGIKAQIEQNSASYTLYA